MAPNAKIGYGRCCVYGIEDTTGKEPDYPYIGSCAKPLYARWGQHLCDSYYKNNTDIVKLIRSRPFDFRPKVLLGPFACANQRDLNTIEQSFINKYNPRCNMRCATRGVVLGLEELMRKLVLPAADVGVVPALRQLTVEEAWGT